MPAELAALLQETIDRELPNLIAISEATSNTADGRPGAWTKKQELGHLVDSAANNHMRFVLASLDGEFKGKGYAQNEWVALHAHSELEWKFLVGFWYRFNTFLAHLVERIPEDQMQNSCAIGTDVVTLGFVIQDYVRHMRHHIEHILAR
jgi:hypothetical protein